MSVLMKCLLKSSLFMWLVCWGLSLCFAETCANPFECKANQAMNPEAQHYVIDTSIVTQKSSPFFTWPIFYFNNNQTLQLSDEDRSELFRLQRLREDLLQRIYDLKHSCFESLGFELHDFEKVYYYSSIFPVSINNKLLIVYNDEQNFIANKIKVGGRYRTFANLVSINSSKTSDGNAFTFDQQLIFVDLEKWKQQRLYSTQLRILAHEHFGLMGLEGTDDYTYTNKLFDTFINQSCQKYKEPEKNYIFNLEDNCNNKIDIFSSHNISRYYYDPKIHMLGAFSEADRCMYFWNAKENKREHDYDIKVSLQAHHIQLDAGKILISTNDYINQAITYQRSRYERAQFKTILGHEPGVGDRLFPFEQSFFPEKRFYFAGMKSKVRVVNEELTAELVFDKSVGSEGSAIVQVIPLRDRALSKKQIMSQLNSGQGLQIATTTFKLPTLPTKQAVSFDHRQLPMVSDTESDFDINLFNAENVFAPHLLIYANGQVDYIYIEVTNDDRLSLNSRPMFKIPKELLHLPISHADSFYFFNRYGQSIYWPLSKTNHQQVIAGATSVTAGYAQDFFLDYLLSSESDDFSLEDVKQLSPLQAKEHFVRAAQDNKVVIRRLNPANKSLEPILSHQIEGRVEFSHYDGVLQKWVVVVKDDSVDPSENLNVINIDISHKTIQDHQAPKIKTCKFFSNACK